jgi:hypothetical protein
MEKKKRGEADELLFTFGEPPTPVYLRPGVATAAELEAHRARLPRGQYVLIPDFSARRLSVVPYRERSLLEARDALVIHVQEALAARPHWIRRFAPSAPTGKEVGGVPSLGTRSPLQCLAMVGGVRRLAQYARYLTLFHPTTVPWYAARLAQSGLEPQPVWLASRPPHHALRGQGDTLIAWEHARAPPNVPRPSPRLMRFPPTVYGDSPDQQAKLLAILALPTYEGCAVVGDSDTEQRGLFLALLHYLFPDDLPELDGGDAKPHQLFALGYALALTGREVTGPSYANDKAEEVTDALCLYVSETLASLQMRKTPFYQ